MNPYYWFFYSLWRLAAYFLFQLRTVHGERMLHGGSVILAANHESFLDPPLLGIACKRAIYFLAKRELMNVWWLGWLLPKLNVIPVDLGGSDRSALKKLIRVLNSGEGALIFPEGGRTTDGKLQSAQPGLGLIIAKTLAPVVPMRIFGAHEAWPPGGRLRLRPITVVVGEPIVFTEADLQPRTKELYQQLSQRVLNAIAALQPE